MFRLLISASSFLLFILCNEAQDHQLPPVACPNYFQYFLHNAQYVGKISIPTVSHNVELSVHLSQKQQLETNYYGRIILENRDPLVYRIEFPSPREVPKLTKITVNGEDICTQSGYSAPSMSIFLNHRLSTQPLSSSFPQIPSHPYPVNTFVVKESPQKPPAQENPTPLQPPKNHINDSKESREPEFSPSPKFGIAECGVSTEVTPFVFGGNEIMPGEFPWLTAIYVKSAGLRFLCGGSLVSSRTVVSAGHCFKIGSLSASRLVVHLGRHNLEDYSEQSFITREIETLTIHPEYNSNLFPDADLAILHLKQSVKYTTNIRPICLWTDNSDSNFIVGETGVVAGWGADEKGHAFTPLPKRVNTKIVSDGECLRSSAAYNMLTSPRTFCAGNRDDTGPCMGDSGSGLMISRNGYWFLRGVVSAGQTKNRQCNLQEFVVFCDVAKHLQWVQKNLVS